MTGTVPRLTSPEPYRSIIYLGAIILLRAVGQAILYGRGFLSVSADEYARGIAAAKWALQPRFDLFDVSQGAWLPFERYLNGLLLGVWPDVILVPRVTVFLSSCLVVIALYVLVYYLFRSFAIAALASIFVVVQPWIVWLSGTPMMEMYYLAFYFAGLFFLLVWLKDDRRGFWILAGFSFLIATGYHVQSWYLINLVNLVTIGFLIGFVRHKQYGRLMRLIGYYFLSNALIIAFVAVEFFHTGEMLGFLATHTTYSRWFYGGYDVSLLEKLFFYARLVLQNNSFVVWILLITSLVFLRSDRERLWKLFPFVLAISSLALISLSNLLSGPPSAAPARYSAYFTLLLAPYVAYGAAQIFRLGKQQPSHLTRYSLISLSLILFLYSLFWGAVRTFNHPEGPREAINVGRHLNALINQTDPEDSAKYMVELKYWDFLRVQLTAGHYENVVYDRVQDITNRQTPSVFEEEPDDYYDTLARQNVRYIALHDPELKAKVQRASFLSVQEEIGAWTIYEFEP
jgi:hypothetical protein